MLNRPSGPPLSSNPVLAIKSCPVLIEMPPPPCVRMVDKCTGLWVDQIHISGFCLKIDPSSIGRLKGRAGKSGKQDVALGHAHDIPPCRLTERIVPQSQVSEDQIPTCIESNGPAGRRRLDAVQIEESRHPQIVIRQKVSERIPRRLELQCWQNPSR